MKNSDEKITRETSTRAKVVVLNPYLPIYRVPFFLQLEEALALKGFELELVTGKPTDEFRQRDDFAALPFHQVKRQMSTIFLGFRFRYLFASSNIKQSSAVIYEFSITNLNTWKSLCFPRRHKAILWGHGPSYLSKENFLRLKLQRIMARKADLVLTYTEPGRAKVISLGIESQRVVAINNTIDTRNITEAMASVTASEVEDFKIANSISSDDKVFSFIGALDKTKRINFIQQVLDEIWSLDKSFKLIVGGAGPERYRLNDSVDRGQTVYLGRVGSKEKALIAKVAKGIVNPGNTGLLAVDALVMKLPIFGTNALASPEKDYLAEGSSFFTLSSTPKKFAEELLSLFGSDLFSRVRGEAPKIESMVKAFAEAVESQFPISRDQKLLIVTNLPAPYRISLFEELAEHFEVTVVFTGWRNEGRSWDEGGEKSSKFSSVYGARLLGIGKVRIPFATSNLKRLISESDVVLTGGWNSPVYFSSLRSARKEGKKSILWFESTLDSARFLTGPIALLRSLSFRLPDAIYVPGDSAAQAAKQYSGGKVPVTVLSNPIHPMFLEASATSDHMDLSKGIKFLYFGRLVDFKNVNLLIDAFSIAATTKDTLTIVGGGPMKGTLEQKAQMSPLRNQIEFRNAVVDAEALEVYRDHHVLVLPSKGEVWGLVIAEALVLGLRVIASDSAGATHAFRRFSTLLTFKTGSAIDLAGKMAEVRNSEILKAEDWSHLLELNSPKIFATKMRSAVNEIKVVGSFGDGRYLK